MIVISDVHQEDAKYLKIVKNAEKQNQHTLQLGDMGFNYDFLKKVDPKRHVFFKGNHDNYMETETLKSGHNLGDYGPRKLDGQEFFMVRGGHSIDVGLRRPFIDWFPNEQLSWGEGIHCIQSYEQVKPDLVITHEAPQSVLDDFFPDRSVLEKYGYHPQWCSSTAVLLQLCLDIHRPALWIFGHFHTKIDRTVGGTQFKCMYELGTIKV